jgi:hypothetical protein
MARTKQTPRYTATGGKPPSKRVFTPALENESGSQSEAEREPEFHVDTLG